MERIKTTLEKETYFFKSVLLAIQKAITELKGVSEEY